GYQRFGVVIRQLLPTRQSSCMYSFWLSRHPTCSTTAKLVTKSKLLSAKGRCSPSACMYFNPRYFFSRKEASSNPTAVIFSGYGYNFSRKLDSSRLSLVTPTSSTLVCEFGPVISISVRNI